MQYISLTGCAVRTILLQRIFHFCMHGIILCPAAQDNTGIAAAEAESVFQDELLGKLTGAFGHAVDRYLRIGRIIYRGKDRVPEHPLHGEDRFDAA